MHEMGIANSILEAVLAEASRHPRAQPQKVGVRIGELAAVDADALRFCFEALIRETKLASLELEIEICRRRQRCQRCSTEFEVNDFEFRCPHCGEEQTQCISGDELDLVYLELEEYEANTAGKQNSGRE
jgi:hydrogenase nickel incorporation protein HypA/HybF